jgi:metal-responsive CopG/Arc/MetJ family transcriptional regulator
MQMTAIRATITLDEALFEEANQVAESLDVSRSRLIAVALREYMERRRSAQILAALNEAYADDLDQDERRFLGAGTAALRAANEKEGAT